MGWDGMFASVDNVAWGFVGGELTADDVRGLTVGESGDACGKKIWYGGRVSHRL
jgi:hypothetical protein